MTERYDRSAAAHYAAYRPPLHQTILRTVLSTEESFSVGLDVGCGAGHSAVALAGYCTSVYGADPSLSMLTRAVAQERVDYLAAAAERIPLPENSVDVVTFAGSLHYADTEATAECLRAVCRQGAAVIVYDFAVRLEPILEGMGVEHGTIESDYDHGANFSGVPGFAELDLGTGQTQLPVALAELAHILLSESFRSDQFASKYNTSDVFPSLLVDLRTTFNDATIAADLFYARYRLTDPQ